MVKTTKKTKDPTPKIEEMDIEMFDFDKPVKTTKKAKKGGVSQFLITLWCVIIGLGKILALVSIAFTSYQVLASNGDQLAKALVAPQIILAASMLVRAFVLEPWKNNNKEKK